MQLNLNRPWTCTDLRLEDASEGQLPTSTKLWYAGPSAGRTFAPHFISTEVQETDGKATPRRASNREGGGGQHRGFPTLCRAIRGGHDPERGGTQEIISWTRSTLALNGRSRVIFSSTLKRDTGYGERGRPHSYVGYIQRHALPKFEPKTSPLLRPIYQI
ncbi:hypothetical protein J6590_023138 [Homalodisca vitripennis]|nr:hypothetical protein J6590_023138 [Homalodisca vitripennis]